MNKAFNKFNKFINKFINSDIKLHDNFLKYKKN